MSFTHRVTRILLAHTRDSDNRSLGLVVLPDDYRTERRAFE